MNVTDNRFQTIRPGQTVKRVQEAGGCEENVPVGDTFTVTAVRGEFVYVAGKNGREAGGFYGRRFEVVPATVEPAKAGDRVPLEALKPGHRFVRVFTTHTGQVVLTVDEDGRVLWEEGDVYSSSLEKFREFSPRVQSAKIVSYTPPATAPEPAPAPEVDAAVEAVKDASKEPGLVRRTVALGFARQALGTEALVDDVLAAAGYLESGLLPASLEASSEPVAEPFEEGESKHLVLEGVFAGAPAKVRVSPSWRDGFSAWVNVSEKDSGGGAALNLSAESVDALIGHLQRIRAHKG